MQFLIIMVLMLGVMYVLMIRPQRQRQAQQQSMIDGADVGDDVLTTGGIYGTITQAENDDIVVEIAKRHHGAHDAARNRGRASSRRGEEEADDVDAELADADADDDADEGVVTDGEEAVRSAAGDASPGDDRG